jgi:hypothetical protein
VSAADAPTWAQIVAAIPGQVRDDIAEGSLDPSDDDAVAEYASEWADGSQYVIYHHHAARLFMDGDAVSDFEAEAWDAGAGAELSVLSIMSTCVYLALSAAVVAAVADVVAEQS